MKPSSGRSYARPHPGPEPYFYRILPVTLTPESCESFLRSTSLPIAARDYYLSKLFQFLHLPLVLKFLLEDDPTEVSERLEEFLNGIPPECTERLAEFDWSQFYDDTLRYDLHDVLRRLPLHLPRPKREPSSEKMTKERLAGGGTPERVRRFEPFRMPEGATWKDVSIKFTSDFRVQLTVLDVTDSRSYSEMGFADHRNPKLGKPIAAWGCLIQLAENSGTIRRPKEFNSEKSPLDKHIQAIRIRLKKLFLIADDPFEPFAKLKVYKARFRIECAESRQY